LKQKEPVQNQSGLRLSTFRRLTLIASENSSRLSSLENPEATVLTQASRFHRFTNRFAPGNPIFDFARETPAIRSIRYRRNCHAHDRHSIASFNCILPLENARRENVDCFEMRPARRFSPDENPARDRRFCCHGVCDGTAKEAYQEEEKNWIHGRSIEGRIAPLIQGFDRCSPALTQDMIASFQQKANPPNPLQERFFATSSKRSDSRSLRKAGLGRARIKGRNLK
jgi:hypothetical protein